MNRELIVWMREHEIPITRENYIALIYPQSSRPRPWTFEDEMQLPEELRDISKIE